MAQLGAKGLATGPSPPGALAFQRRTASAGGADPEQQGMMGDTGRGRALPSGAATPAQRPTAQHPKV